MAYNKNTNWDNEKKYLDNLSKNGTAGQKAWAENQKKELASAQSKYSSSTTTNTGGGSKGGTVGGSSGGGSKGGTTNKNSQYTGSSTGIKTYNSTQQDIRNQMNANSIAWWSADETERKRLEAENQRLSQFLGGSVSYDAVTGLWSGAADGSFEDVYEEENQRPEAPKSDPRIDKLLNEILNRDDFSYDVMNDPLYQQYAAMYQREGDRAMKETLAEAAAGAGGMNTYAITAAQQANSYYGSKLNDMIPQLYQLAYDKHLKDIDLKLQDLGILQKMDATQYDRYRDTMGDWQKDRNFAYGVYYDDIQQGNWQANFDNNNFWKNKDFNYNELWDNKIFDNNESWKVKDWEESESDEAYERNEAEEAEARETIAWYIENGVSADAIPKDLITKSGLDETAIAQMVTYFQTQQATKGKSSGGGGGSGKGSGGSGYTGGSGTGGGTGTGYTGGNGGNPASTEENFKEISATCEQMASAGDKWSPAALAKEALDRGDITKDQYNELLRKYNPLLDVTLGKYDPNYVFSNLK